MITDSTCTAKNERGQWSTKTTGIVNVHRSGENLVYDRKNNKDNQVMLGQSATTEQLEAIEKDNIAELKKLDEASKQEK